MPALTHGRVKNGFNLLPRTITYAQGKCSNDGNSIGQTKDEPTKWQNGAKVCGQRALCCGKPLQYTSMVGANLFRNSRIPTGPANRKFASTVSVGRSFAAKRAIARRTANMKRVKNEGDPKDRSKDVIKKCCLLPTVTFSQPVNAYSNPRCATSAKNSGKKSYQLCLSESNPTNSNVPYQNSV